MNTGGTVSSYHPVQAAAAAVWIQAGLGLWMIVTEEGWWSRLALVGVAWGLVVWVFGESFGGIFAPGLSLLTGAPGAALIYVVAGVLIALPLRAWAGPRLGGLVLAGTGTFWAAMAVLQAWPGRCWLWQGGGSGTLTTMVQTMAQVTQPHAQVSMVSAFGRFDARNGFAVNLFAVVALGLLGAALVSGRPLLLRVAVPAATVFCLADWVLVQDFGVPGGLGTDPSSMVPWVIIAVVSLRRRSPGTRVIRTTGGTRHRDPSLDRAAASCGASPGHDVSQRPLGDRARRGRLVLVGAAPMAAASTDQNADPIIARAVAGASVPADRPAPDFQLTDTSGLLASLGSLRGKVVLLTFLDPVCSNCLTIAGEAEDGRCHAGTGRPGCAGAGRDRRGLPPRRHRRTSGPSTGWRA